MKKFSLMIALLIAVAILAAACAPAATPPPTQAPATAAPAATKAPATTAPANTAAANPTTSGSAGGASAEAMAMVKGKTVTLWNGYHTGDLEETAINQLIDKIRKDIPDAKINVLEVPFDQIFNKWETAIGAGETTPDLLVAPNDSLGNEVRAKLLLPLDDKLKGKTTGVAPLALEGMTVDGKIYGVPQLFKAVALYYNKDKVKAAPKTTDELMTAVKGGSVLVINENNYHNYGFFPAFGGQLMDSSGKCTADQGTGFSDAMQYLLDLKKAGARFETDGGKADGLFTGGQADMIIEGPWVLGGFKKALGDKLGVVPIPAGSKGPAKPLTGVDGFYVNANSKNVDAAVGLALLLTDQNAQKVYSDVAGDVPVRTDVQISDPLVKSFADAAAAGTPRPQGKEFGGWWGPFGDMVTKVIEGKSTPVDGVKEACAAMNKANGK